MDRRRRSEQPSLAERQAEHRKPRRDATEILQGGILRDAFEESTDLEPPLLDVEAQDRRLLRIGQLDGADRLPTPPEPELAPAGGAHVAHPLGLAARRHEILPPLVDQQIDGNRAPLAALPSADREHARAVHADPEPGEPLDQPVERPIDRGRLQVALRRHRDDQCAFVRATPTRPTFSLRPPPRYRIGMRRSLSIAGLLLALVTGPASGAATGPFASNQRIVYSDGLHSENTEMIRLGKRVLLMFRGGEEGQIGSARARLKIFESRDRGKSVTLLSEVDASSLPGDRDIRDPKFVQVGDKLVLYAISRLPGFHYRDLAGEAWTVRSES